VLLGVLHDKPFCLQLAVCKNTDNIQYPYFTIYYENFRLLIM
jgi:hypothetical protein